MLLRAQLYGITRKTFVFFALKIPHYSSAPPSSKNLSKFVSPKSLK